jgi:Flp pilus assembly pilin Flp
MKKVLKLLKDEEGAAAVEWAILAAFIIAICVVIIQSLGVKVQNLYSTVNNIW